MEEVNENSGESTLKRPTANGQRPTANAPLAGGPGAANSVPDMPNVAKSNLAISTLSNSNLDEADLSQSNLGLSNPHSRSATADRIVFLLIAGLLLFTAIAKVWMLATDQFADVRVGISREILWLTVLFEITLVAANLFLRSRPLLSIINATTFTMFGIFATLRWILGYDTCGCSGNIEIPSIVFIAIDWAIVTWFVTGGFGIVGHPLTAMASMRDEFLRWWSAQSSNSRQRWAGAGLFVALLGILQMPFAQPVWTAILGKAKIVAAVRVDGDLRLNQAHPGRVTIHNRSNQAAKVIGMDRSCRCFELAGDPLGLVVPANSQIELPLVIKPNKTGLIQQRIVLFFEHSESFRVPINLFVYAKGDE